MSADAGCKSGMGILPMRFLPNTGKMPVLRFSTTRTV